MEPRTVGAHGARTISIDELPAFPGPHSLTWRPVRRTLGISAFGCNAYTAEEAGVDVVEPHTESAELNHQELYFVARGRARFTIDEETFDAPAGTYVFVPDVRSHRHAVAEEAGTTVLSFGGPPVFEPSPWETAWAASHEPDLDRAIAMVEEVLAEHPDSVNVIYNYACMLATRAADTHRDRALELLGRAIELRPESREWARGDVDFASLRGDEAFEKLVAER
jgi:mannose-6-phosphate isomerase-like protein (cupin superfamily)